MSAHRIVDVEERVSAFARAVALRRATVVAVGGLLLAYAVSQHWITPDLSQTVTRDLEAGLTFASTVGAGAWIHYGTTPAKLALQPTSSDGDLLVPDPALAAAVTAGDEDPEHVLAAAVMAPLATDVQPGIPPVPAAAPPTQPAPVAPDPFMQGGKADDTPLPAEEPALGAHTDTTGAAA